MATYISNDLGLMDLTRVTEALANAFGTTPEAIKNNYFIDNQKLRVTAPLVNGQKSYEFNPVQGNDSALSIENKIAQAEAFVITSVGILLHKATFTASSQRTSEFGMYPVFTQPDSKYFVGTGGVNSTTEAAQLMELYHGATLKIEDNNTPITTIDMLDSLYVPTSTYDATPSVDLQGFGHRGAQRGQVRLYPHVIIDGAKNMRLKLNLGEGPADIISGIKDAAGADQNGTRNMVSIVASGFWVRSKPQGVTCPARI